MQRKLCLLPILAVLAAAQEPNPGRGVNFYSIEREIAQGRQLAADFQRNTHVLNSPAVQAYLTDLGRRLAAQSGNPAFTYTLTLIAEDPAVTHEAVAFPGGFLFVPAGLILAAKDEDELAGMLAHSIAHVAARHGTKQATKAELANIAPTPLMYVGGWAGYAMRQGGYLAIPAGLLGFYRKSELEADVLAVRMMAAAGYDPAALSRYMEREQAPGDTQPKVWSALPAVGQRLAAIQNAMDSLPAQVYDPHHGLDAIQAEVRRLPRPL